jgi:hypothetical protein
MASSDTSSSKTSKSLLRFHAIGHWPRERVSLRWVADSRPRISEIETAIEAAWKVTGSRPGVNLFDGPMCRLESFQVGQTRDASRQTHDASCQTPDSSGQNLHLDISRASYKPFIGTNLSHPEFADRFGWGALANSIGLSSALQSADGFLMLGRRNSSVAYYPNRTHPFAGALEPKEPLDLFAEIERELAEEVGFAPADIASAVCVGLAEDISLRQPELIFAIQSDRTRQEIEATLDAGEHLGSVAIANTRAEVEAALRDPALTPIAMATILLWGRGKWGAGWFDEACPASSAILP